MAAVSLQQQFSEYWTRRGISASCFPVEFHGDAVHYISLFNGKRTPFQWSKSYAITAKGQKKPPFFRMNFRTEQYEKFPLFIDPTFDYSRFAHVFLVEGLPDWGSLRMNDAPALAIRDEGGLLKAKDALNAFFRQYPDITRCVIIPDPGESWKAWTFAAFYLDLRPTIQFINITTALRHAGVVGKKDVNDLWMATRDRETFSRALNASFERIEPPYDWLRAGKDINQRMSADMVVEYLRQHREQECQDEGDEWRVLHHSGLMIKKEATPIDWYCHGANVGAKGVFSLLSFLQTQSPTCNGNFKTLAQELAAHLKYTLPLVELKPRAERPAPDAPDPQVYALGVDARCRSGVNSETHTPPPIEDPTWTFWIVEERRGGGWMYVISALKYIDFLAAHGFRVFLRRNTPMIVRETADGMENTVMRGRINADVKQFVTKFLVTNGYSAVADELLSNGKFFTMDILEMLPPVDEQKAKRSIFSQPDTTIDLTTPLIKEDPIISYDDRKILCAGNMLGIMAKHGVGKTQFMELLISQALNPYCEPYSPFSVTTHGGLVVWIDTEMPHNNMVYAVNRIKRRICADQDPSLLTSDGKAFSRLRIERFAEVDDKLLRLMEMLDELHEPVDIVVIDGALDLVRSMNDEEEATDVANELKRIVGKLHCGLIITIHTSQSSTIDNARPMGHIGAMIGRKCDSLLHLRRSSDDRNIKEVTTDANDNTKVRAADDSGIYSAFRWFDEENMPHFIEYTPPEASGKQTAKDKAKAAFLEIFSEYNDLTFSQLKTLYIEHRKLNGTPVKEDAATNHIRDGAKKWNLLSHENGMYRLRDAGKKYTKNS